MANKKLEPGEKYLTIEILGSLKVSAFPNKNQNPNAPQFKGDGVAVWVNEKKAETVKQDVI